VRSARIGDRISTQLKLKKIKPMITLKNHLNSVVRLSLFATVAAFSVVPQSNAQIDDQEFQMGRAREACTNQAKQQGLTFNRVVSSTPVNGSGGHMIGSEVTMNVTRHGETYNVRCNYDNNSGRATISSQTSPESRTAFVNVDVVNVRSAPGTNSHILYKAPRNTQMKVLGEVSRGDSIWYKVQASSSQYPQAIGYVFGRYLRF
jgi:hypothetical protein